MIAHSISNSRSSNDDGDGGIDNGSINSDQGKEIISNDTKTMREQAKRFTDFKNCVVYLWKLAPFL